MTEFEAATVAYQQAALALQQSQYWAAIGAAIAIPLVAGLVGAGQILVVLKGIRVMQRTSDQREKREDARHAEVMEALRQQGEALRAVVKGLETVIERTAPKE